ncbi:MAG: hypothetical protein AB1898_18815, partial [Acidobacteriota bacterium]
PDAPTVSDDHGFSFWSATAVNVGSITLGNLNLVRDRDYFRFTITQQNSYTVFTRGTTDTVGELYDSNLSQLAVDASSGESPNFRIEKILLPGTYYVLVRAPDFSTVTGSYQLHIEGPGGSTKPSLPRISVPSNTTFQGTVDPNLPTIVLTHGLQEDRVPHGNLVDEIAELWTGTGQKQATTLLQSFLTARSINANIIRVIWDGAFQTYSASPIPTQYEYVKAREEAQGAGTTLGSALAIALGPGYKQKVHFIGHSLGTVVNAYALTQLLATVTTIKEAQFTVLDFPHHIERIPLFRRDLGHHAIPKDFFAGVFADILSGVSLRIDNYYAISFFSQGDEITKIPVYRQQYLVDPKDLGDSLFGDESGWTGVDNNHSGVQQWYRWTINPVEQFPDPRNISECPGVLGFLKRQSLSDTLNPCRTGWDLSILRQPAPSSSASSSGTRLSRIRVMLSGPQSFGCTYDAQASAPTVICQQQSASGLAGAEVGARVTDSGSPFLEAQVEIPVDAEFLSFKYRFNNSGDGDFAAILLDDQPVWKLLGSGVTPGLLQDSGAIPISGFRGRRKLTVALYGVGQPDFGFQIMAINTSAVLGQFFVPILLSAAGLNNSFFTSELTLTNRGAHEASLELNYVASFGGGSGSARVTLPPRKQLVVSDAMSYLGSLGVPVPLSGNRGGTLSINSAGVSSSEVAVTVRTTASVPNGRAGLAYPGVPVSSALTGPAYLCGLRQDFKDRSNLAVQHAGSSRDGDIVLRLTVFSGDKAGPFSRALPDITLSPSGFHQISGILQSNGLNLTNGFVRVERVAGTAPYYAYAVINDQVNSDGSFVPPILESSLMGRTGLTLPVVVEGGGFDSELVLTNWSPKPVKMILSFVSDSVQAAGNTVGCSRTLQAGEQVIVPSFVQFLRENGLGSELPSGPTYAGPLFATTEEGDVSGVFLGARTATAGGAGQFGVFYTAVPNGMASTDTAWLYGLQQNDENRTNLAIVNTGEVDGEPDLFRIELFDGETGLQVNTVEGITVNARRWTQIGTVLSRYAPGVSQGYARVTRISGNNPFITYAVINDGGFPGQRSGDGAFVASSP